MLSQEGKHKGGRKGGKTYPRYSLEELDKYIERVSSKASTKPLDHKSFCAGVFDIKHNPVCKTKISALKQFGLIEEKGNELLATQLCKQVGFRPKEERAPYYAEAFKKVDLFVLAAGTYGGKKATLAQLGTYAVETLGIHFDNKEGFATKLIDSAKIAGLCHEQDDGYVFSSIDSSETQEREAEGTTEGGVQAPAKPPEQKTESRTGGRVNIELKIDSTVSPEQLEKYLQKLRDFGLI